MKNVYVLLKGSYNNDPVLNINNLIKKYCKLLIIKQ